MPIQGLPFTDKQLFDIINVVLPGWLLLALVPRWKYSYTAAALGAIVVGALYVGTLAYNLTNPSGSVDLKDMFSYEGVQKLLAQPETTLPAWTHFAAFDLWTGMWVASDSVSHGVPQLLMIPCLFFVMMLGPTGLLAYLLVRIPWAGLALPGPPAAGRKAKTN